MQIYVDTSALVKVVVLEAESAALQGYFENFAADIQFTSSLARAELVRALAGQGSTEVIDNARLALSKLNFVPLNNTVLDAAAMTCPPELLTLDAIHLAAARTAPDLRALVTYDSRLADAAVNAGIAVVSPS